MGTGTSFPVIGRVYSRADDKPLEGARVCIANHEEIPCAIVDPSGRYALELPAWREPMEIAVHVSAPGHLGFTGIIDNFEISDWPEGPRPSTWWGGIGLADDEKAGAWLRDKAGLRFPAADRAFVEVTTNAPVGSTLHLMPGHDLKAVYENDMRVSDPDLTSLSRSGTMLFGEVPPGRFEVIAAGCEEVGASTDSWKSQGRNAVAGFAMAGSLTHVLLFCRR